jgi:formamidopyrimidine-DNA glycosylase
VPELPEVETVRRMLDAHVLGRTVARTRLSNKKLRTPISPAAFRKLVGRTIESTGRHGKYLFVHFSGGVSLLSHLGMSGRWLFSVAAPTDDLPHVHATLVFADGSWLRYQDPRRFGLVRVLASDRIAREPEIAKLGPDPIAAPPDPVVLRERARGRTVAVKAFLLDQGEIAGVGNIYASEILHRTGVHPARKAGSIREPEWSAIASETRTVLEEAIDRMGTTFSTYRTLWNEPGQYGEQLRVYDRAGKPCRNCGQAIRRSVIGQRSTFFCPSCQPARRSRTGKK